MNSSPKRNIDIDLSTDFDNDVFGINDNAHFIHSIWAFVVIAAVLLGLLIGAGIAAIAI